MEMAHVRVQTPSSAVRAKGISPKFEDSPSRQLILDLERALSQVQIHEVELQKVHCHDRRLFQETLDQLDTRRADEDVAALDAATIRHESVRKEAEAELNKYLREVEEQRRLERQEEKRREQEQQARVRAEAERKTRKETERRERLEREQAAARKAAEEKARAEEATRRKQEDDAAHKKAEKELKRRHEQENERAKQQAAEEEAARASAAQTPSTLEQQSPSQRRASTGASGESYARHQTYLRIHQQLKKFRREFWAQCKKDVKLKSKVGDMRRAIKTSVGQLTEAKGANKLPTERIKATLKDALSIQSPPVDVRDYFAAPPPEWQTAEHSRCPSLLIYVLNIFSKAIVSRFGGESGISIKAAEPAGVLVAQIFAATEYQLKGHSLIDILLAKLHFACPVLWGVYGDETTAAGRLRLGWRKEDGVFVSESRHHERVSGLGAGFASIALRNFTKARLQNPFPPTNFWECLANILNVPPGDVQPTHLFVLKAMLENSAERLIQFYGSAAIAALRLALIDFPANLPPKMQDTAGCKAITVLVDMLAREKNLTIA